MRLSVSSITLVACTSLAAAADLEGPSYLGSLKDDIAAPAAYNWSGLYFGGHVGYGWGDTSSLSIFRDKNGNILDGEDGKPAVSHTSHDIDGWLGGIQLGYNIQSGNWVFGIEGDYSWTDISGSFKYDPRPTEPDKIAGSSIDWLATVRGRVGYAFDRIMVYGTAGIAFAELGGFIDDFMTGGDVDRAETSSTETGLVVGGGLEVALMHNLSLRGEYLYYKFDNASGAMRAPDWPEGSALHIDSDVELHTFRVGVNYKFGN